MVEERRVKWTMIHPNCRDFVTAVEDLLTRRQDEKNPSAPARGSRPHDEWWPRTWTRTEFEDVVYSSYKPMRQGRVTRPPRREIVMDIADYLDCSLEERNHLLLAARATPVAPYMTGAPLDEALRVAMNVARNLPLPAIILNRDWQIHFINQPMLSLIGVTLAEVAAIPARKLNILHLLFDPALPLHGHLIQNRSSWTRMVRQTMYGFKMANTFCQFERWYQDLLDQLSLLPEFEEHWRSVRVDKNFETDPSAQNQSVSAVVEIAVNGAPSNPESVRLRPLLVSVGYFQFDFPQIVAFMPVDDESRAALRRIGVPAPESPPSPI